ncbi:kinase-like protein [Xylaria sp. FL1042]|nr:kinase-like protein [Xylaria sp. FL1042]
MASSSRYSLGNSSQYSDSISDLSRQSSGQSQHSTSSSYSSTGHDLYHQLSSRIVKCDNEQQTQALSRVSFLPLDAVDEVITTDMIKTHTSSWYGWWKGYNPAEMAAGAKIVFAILGLFGMEKLFLKLFIEGLRDEHLPLARRCGRGHPNDLYSPRGDRFETFSTGGPSYTMAVDSFLQKQWQVLAPVFNMSGGDIRIHGDAALPFYDIQKKSALNNRSTVYKALLHAAHIRPKMKNAVEIAIKDYTEKEDFDKEKENLLKIKDVDNPHLIRHIATIQQGKLFYVIFPWANGGTLLEFWNGDPTAVPTRNHQIFMWCLQQMLGLVDALFALHDMNCRHGDLKPENILHFKDLTKIGEFGTLVIADVGVSKFHSLATENRRDPTNTNATTPCYEAPEAVTDRKRPRGRRYDIWSVGCMFMEFTIWLLYGYQAIHNFEQRRRENDDPFPHKAPYYEVTGPHTAIVHPVVSYGLKALEKDPRCAKGTGLASFINLIAKDLIVVEPEKRVKAGELKGRLRGIVERAGEDPGYLMKRVEPPPRIPVPFTPGKCGDGNG